MIAETIQQIQENPYLQYFVGLPDYSAEQPIVPSLFVEIRKHMSPAVFQSFHKSTLSAIDIKQAACKVDLARGVATQSAPEWAEQEGGLLYILYVISRIYCF